MIAEERLYLTEDRKKVVSADDPKAKYLLAGKGQEIPEKISRNYGLEKKRAKKAPNKMVESVDNKSEDRED